MCVIATKPFHLQLLRENHTIGLQKQTKSHISTKFTVLCWAPSIALLAYAVHRSQIRHLCFQLDLLRKYAGSKPIDTDGFSLVCDPNPLEKSYCASYFSYTANTWHQKLEEGNFYFASQFWSIRQKRQGSRRGRAWICLFTSPGISLGWNQRQNLQRLVGPQWGTSIS